jgi:undecaprenyl-phosphate galactose phosphotransferase/putative colanic acid biosynthesis UDP-glucose lipid carrier transferase
LGRIAGAGFLAIVLVVNTLFLLKVSGAYSRGAVVVFCGSAPLGVVLERLMLGGYLRWAFRSGMVKGRAAVVIGDVNELDSLSGHDFLEFGIAEAASFRLRFLANSPALAPIDRITVIWAIDAARKLRVNELALMVPWECDVALDEILRLVRISPLPVRLYPDANARRVMRRNANPAAAVRAAVELQRAPLSWAERALKRTTDIVLAGLALLTLAPLLAIVAVCVRLESPGPAIFRQRRRGFDSDEFVIYKFRTMYVVEDGDRIVQATRNDSRVTRLGRVLRRTSIDELPQLLNVLRGDMSIVGPRPHAVAHDEEYKAKIGDYALRHHVKPGLTGAAQVAGLRGETPTLSAMEDRIQKDLWYVDNWSPLLDMKIILQTFVELVRREAY